jgi:dephospho-CoA kinase
VLRVGLTGGIASGKSRVVHRLAARGAATLDLDAVAREVTAPGSPALAEIAAAFGRGVLDAQGALDRAAMAALVFADAGARERLNRIVHPRVRAAESRWAAARSGPEDALLVTDGALLIEAGLHLRFDRLVVVHCAEALQVERLRLRDGLDAPTARRRVAAQLPAVEKRAFAHFEIDSSGAHDDTDRAADALADALARLAAADRRRPALDPEALLGGLVHGPESGPRGLSPEVLIAEAAGPGGLDMEALARRLVPAAQGPWYRAARGVTPELPGCRLGVALAAWALARRGHDPEFAAAAAGSVARLVHEDAEPRADACLVTLVALAWAAAPHARLAGLAAGSRELATRFGGGAPSGRLDAVWSAVERCPGAPEAAGELAGRLGGDPATAAALAGIARPVADSEPARRWRAALGALRG